MRRALAVCAILGTVFVVGGSTGAHPRGPNPQDVTTYENVTIDFDDEAPEPSTAIAQRSVKQSGKPSWFAQVLNSLKARPTATASFSRTVELPVRIKRAPLAARGSVVGAGIPRKDVNAWIGCEFSIEVSTGNWDINWDARLLDPSNNQIDSSVSWVSQKPGTNSSVGLNVSDPEEGTYRCTINWTVDTFSVPQRLATQTLSYEVPSSETSSLNGWSGNYLKFQGILLGGLYHGRKVREQDGGGGWDYCKQAYNNQIIPTFLSVTGGPPWDVSNGVYGDDFIGWGVLAISTGGAGCRAEFDQDMQINKGSQWSLYKTNRIKTGIGDTHLWSERDGVQDARSW